MSQMPGTPLFILRESPQRIPERIREFDASARAIIRPALVCGIPCSLAALCFYHTEIAPLIHPPPKSSPVIGILLAPFALPSVFIFIRLVLSHPRLRDEWRHKWSFWPKALARQNVFGTSHILWRNVRAFSVEAHDDQEGIVRLTLAPRRHQPSAELAITFLRNNPAGDVDFLRERIAELVDNARTLSG